MSYLIHANVAAQDLGSSYSRPISIASSDSSSADSSPESLDAAATALFHPPSSPLPSPPPSPSPETTLNNAPPAFVRENFSLLDLQTFRRAVVVDFAHFCQLEHVNNDDARAAKHQFFQRLEGNFNHVCTVALVPLIV